MATITVRPDLSPRLVIVDLPDTEITVQQAVDLIRDWEDSMEGMSYPRIVDAAGKEALGGGVEVGITVTLQNAQIYFAARNTVHASGTATSAGASGEFLTDSVATFLDDGISVGDTLFNSTTGAMATVVDVTGDTQLQTLPLYGGTRQDWQIGDAYGVYLNEQCNISGGNMVAVDGLGASIPPILASPNTQVVRTASSSATSQQLAAIEYAAFNNAVWINVDSPHSEGGYAEVGRPIGTPQDPVNNVPAAVAIQAEKGLPKEIRILGNLTVGTGDDLTGFRIVGQNAARTTFTINPIAVVGKAEILECFVTGTLDDQCIVRNCYVQDLTYFQGFLFQSEIGGTITLGGNAQADILQCYSGVAGTNTPTIDMGGSGNSLGLRAYSGGIKIINKTGPEGVSIDFISGQAKVDLDTCTNGKIVARGPGKMVNDDDGDHLPSGLYGGLELVNETLFGIMVQEIWTKMGLDPDVPATLSDNGTTTTITYGTMIIEMTDTSIQRTA